MDTNSNAYYKKAGAIVKGISDGTTTINGQTATEAKESLDDLKQSAENLTTTKTGSDVYNLADSINDLSSALQEYYEADEDRDGTELAAAIDDVCSKLTEVMEWRCAVVPGGAGNEHDPGPDRRHGQSYRHHERIL